MVNIFDDTPGAADARKALAHAMTEPIRVAMLPEWQAMRGLATSRPEPRVVGDAARRRAEAMERSMAKRMTAAQDAEVKRLMSSFMRPPSPTS